MSYTVLGASLDLLRKPENRWLCRSLLDGNRHMYMQMTWPGLFAKLRILIDPTKLTYPSYLKDSERFLSLMEATMARAAEETARAPAAQRHQPSRTCAVIDHMRRGFSGDVDDEEIKTEAFSLLRAGNEHQSSSSMSAS